MVRDASHGLTSAQDAAMMAGELPAGMDGLSALGEIAARHIVQRQQQLTQQLRADGPRRLVQQVVEAG